VSGHADDSPWSSPELAGGGGAAGVSTTVSATSANAATSVDVAMSVNTPAMGANVVPMEASAVEAPVAEASMVDASSALDASTRAATASAQVAAVCKVTPAPKTTTTDQPTSPTRAENRALRGVLMECSPSQSGCGGAQALIDLAAEALASPCAPFKHQYPPSRPSRLRQVHSQSQREFRTGTAAADATQLLDALVSHGRTPSSSMASLPAKGDAQVAAAMVQLRHRLALDLPTASYSYLGLNASHRNPPASRDQHQTAQRVSPVCSMR